jgi:pyruvate dehydrogenase E2 component (dihydrolipoamide acetyltransferase)
MINDIVLPSMGESITEATVSEINVKVGDTVKADQTIALMSADKVDAEVPAGIDGIVTEIVVAVNDVVKIGATIIKIEVGGAVAPTPAAEAPKAVEASVAAPAPVAIAAPAAVTAAPASNTGGEIKATPVVKNMARDFGIDLSKITASGEHGRITKEDFNNYVANRVQATPAAASATTSAAPQKALPDFAKWGDVEIKDLTGIGKATAENLTYAWNNIPHAWLGEKIDITDIEAMRQKYKDQVKAEGGSLTMTSLLVKACAQALHKFPTFNASADMQNKKVIFKKYVNIGVAVDTDRGLLVPVIKNADKMGLTEISQVLSRISKETREGTLKNDEMQGATFTISNVGGIGTTVIHPIVNWPQSAIMGVSGSNMEPVWNGEAFIPRMMMPIFIGFDHRIINGADVARFLVHVKGLMEDPMRLMF